MTAVRTTSPAERDIAEATYWYLDNASDPETGRRFQAAVRAAVREIGERGFDSLGRDLDDPSVRYARVSRFPHLLIVRVAMDATIEVVALHHPSRDDAFWRSRL